MGSTWSKCDNVSNFKIDLSAFQIMFKVIASAETEADCDRSSNWISHMTSFVCYMYCTCVGVTSLYSSELERSVVCDKYWIDKRVAIWLSCRWLVCHWMWRDVVVRVRSQIKELNEKKGCHPLIMVCRGGCTGSCLLSPRFRNVLQSTQSKDVLQSEAF